MNETWPNEFEVSLEGAKRVVVEPDSGILDCGPLLICFENRTLAHIVSTFRTPRNGSLSYIYTPNIFVLYCMLKSTISTRYNDSRRICEEVLKT